MARYHKQYYLIPRPSKRSETGEIWYYQLHGETTKHSTGCTEEMDAEQYVLNIISQENVKRRERHGTKLYDYANQFYLWDTCPHVTRKRRLEQQITRRYVDEQRRLLEKHILPHPVCKKLLWGVKKGDIIQFQHDLSQKLSPRQCNKVVKILSVIFGTAEEWELISRNPCYKIGYLKEHFREVGTFTGKELAALFTEFEWTSPIERLCWVLSGLCGLRRGEVLALSWDRVDLEKRVITVDRAIKAFSKGRLNDEFGPPKWGKTRQVPMPQAVLDALRDFRRDTPYVMPTHLVLTHPETGLLFSEHQWQSSWKRNMIKSGFIQREWRKGEDAQKAPIITNPRKLTPHSLRHSLNTILRSEGADPSLLRATFGWTTERVQEGYTHLGAEHAQAQIRLIDGLGGKAPDSHGDG